MSEELDARSFTNNANATILIREAIVNKPMNFYSTTITLEYDPNNLLSEQPFHKIYDCKSVCIYVGNEF